MNRKQKARRKLARIAHPRSIQRARTERRYEAEQKGLTCVKACPRWYPDREHSSQCGVCGRKLKKVRVA